MKWKLLIVAAAALALSAGCRSGPGPAADADGDASAPYGSLEAARLGADEIAAAVRAVMDPAADPCQDFYRYACGGWLDHTELPADQTRWTRVGGEVTERNRQRIHEILEEISADPAAHGDLAKVGWYYGSCMDEAAVETRGAAPVAPWLERIAAIDSTEAVMRVAGELIASGFDPLFSAFVEADYADPDRNIAHFYQGGLGMPDRDYYLSDEPRFADVREAYAPHVARMFGLAGFEAGEASAKAARVVAFETALARSSRPRQELRDPVKNYNKIDLAGLRELTPGLDWAALIAATGKPAVHDINVAQPEFFEALDGAFDAAGLDGLRDYLQWQVLSGSAGALSSAFVDEDFAFFGRELRGQKEIEPRWKRCVSSATGAMGELVGKAFVERYFAGDSKEKSLELLHGIQAAFTQALPSLEWMDDSTRERADQKMRMMDEMIGYPDQWRDYSTLEVSDRPYFDNRLAGERFEVRRQLDKIGNPVDRKEWGMPPSVVNAYYHPLRNQMVFLAGILQPPVFHRDLPMAMNFGAIGMVMGHELSHGFDDSGRKFDGEGKLREWWDPGVATRYEERAACVEKLYDSYELQPGLFVNGALTLGENIADLGGIKQAWLAYQDWKRQHGTSGPIVDGLTDDQLFFVSYGQAWCALVTPEREAELIATDTHSPPRYRVIGPLSSLPAFAETFACAEGTPMNPPERCEVW